MNKTVKDILNNFHNELNDLKNTINSIKRSKSICDHDVSKNKVDSILKNSNIKLQELIQKVLKLKSIKDALFCASSIVDMYKLALDDIGELKTKENILNELDNKLYSMEKECKLKNLI